MDTRNILCNFFSGIEHSIFIYKGKDGLFMIFYLIDDKKYLDFNTLLSNSLITRSSLYRILQKKISNRIKYQNKVLYRYDEVINIFGEILFQ